MRSREETKRTYDIMYYKNAITKHILSALVYNGVE